MPHPFQVKVCHTHSKSYHATPILFHTHSQSNYATPIPSQTMPHPFYPVKTLSCHTHSKLYHATPIPSQTMPHPLPSIIWAAATMGDLHPNTERQMELLNPVGMTPSLMEGVTGTNLDLRRLTPLWCCVWMRMPFKTSLKSPSPPTDTILREINRTQSSRHFRQFSILLLDVWLMYK